MDYLDELIEKVKQDGQVIELYPQWGISKVASELSSRYSEYKVNEFNGFAGSIIITKRMRAFIKGTPLDKDEADKLAAKIDLIFMDKKKAKPDLDQWTHVVIGVNCGYLHDVIAYLDETTEYKVTKSKHNHGIRFTLKNKRGQYDKYGFKNMGVDDYYTLNDDDKITSVRAYASNASKKLGIKLRVSAKERRIYRIA